MKINAFYLILIFIVALPYNAYSRSDTSKTSQGIDYPEHILLVNDEEHSRLQIQCEEIKNTGRIRCTFDQLTISKSSDKIDTLDEELFSGANAEESIQEMQKNLCSSELDQILEIANEFPSVEHDEFKNCALKFCNTPSIKNLINVYKAHLKKEVLTCQLSEITFKQDFEYNPFNNRWYYGPTMSYNECGNIEVSYFEKTEIDTAIWNYHRKISITAPEKMMTSNLSCKNMEFERLYSSPLSSRHSLQTMDCKYIEMEIYIAKFR